MKRSTLVALVVILVLLCDQILKIWIKTNFYYGQEVGIFGLSWARLHFVENKGMAFGISLGGSMGKLALSIFRILAVAFLVYIIRILIKSKESKGLLICFGLILAGAIGNILDSAFYGLLFSDSMSGFHSQIPATFLPEEGGYAPLLFGKVVDMLYFPMIDTSWPKWVPWLGGTRFEFFKPVFNIADAAISVGVISLLLFHRKFLRNASAASEEEVHKSVLQGETATILPGDGDEEE